MCMHLTNDILQVVGEVSVQMQDPVCTILDIPGFYETLRTLIFAVKQCTTPKIAQFMEEYDPVQQAWNNVKLKSAVRAQRGHQVQENTVQEKFESLFGPFLDDISHNLTVRFVHMLILSAFFQNSKFSIHKIGQPLMMRLCSVMEMHCCRSFFKSLQETVLEIFFHLKRFVALEMNGLVSKCTLSNKLLKSDHQCNCISIFSSQNITNPNPSSNIFGFFLSLYYVSACQPLLWKGCFLY